MNWHAEDDPKFQKKWLNLDHGRKCGKNDDSGSDEDSENAQTLDRHDMGSASSHAYSGHKVTAPQK